MSLDLPANFGVPKPKPPAMQPWGLRIAYIVDPSGVLWHVAQRDRIPRMTNRIRFKMNVQEQINEFIASHPEPKRTEMQAVA